MLGYTIRQEILHYGIHQRLTAAILQ